MSGIGLLNEKPLHASLKQWYARPGDRFEVPVESTEACEPRNGSAARCEARLRLAGSPLKCLGHALRTGEPKAEPWAQPQCILGGLPAGLSPASHRTAQPVRKARNPFLFDFQDGISQQAAKTERKITQNIFGAKPFTVSRW
jgi:hypothetical protein